ncbi:MAG: polysaccharide biosynthesis protein [Clostridiaceae bacterium]|nr:polysaccharide biosynthesis protein [Clostridiaceae bacterium]
MKKQSTSKGFAVLSAAGMFVKVLSLLYIGSLQRIITKPGYGEYSAAYQIYAFVYVLTNAGIPVAISKMISEFTAVKNYKDAIKSFKIARLLLLCLGVIMTLLLILFARPITRTIGYPKTYWAVLALAPAILLTSIASAYRGYFQGRGNMTPTAISQVIEQVINIVFTLVLAAIFMKKGLEAGLAGGAAATTLGAFFSVTYLIVFYEKNKKFKVHKSESTVEIIRFTNNQIVRKIMNYGVPITICIGMTYAGNLVDVGNVKSRLLITGLFTKDQASALYGSLVKYQQFLNVPIAIITALAAAILPAIAAAVILKNKKEVRNKINYALRICFLIAVPAAVGLAVLSSPVFTLIFGKGYSDGAELMRIGSIVLVLMAVVQIQTSILQGIGKIYTATIYAVIGIIAKIASNYFLIARPNININGAIFGSMIGFAIPLLLNHRMIRKTLKVKISLVAHIIKPLISSGVMGLAVYLVYTYLNLALNFVVRSSLSNVISVVVAISIGAFVYAYSLILTGGITSIDLEVMPSKLTKFIPKIMLSKIR